MRRCRYTTVHRAAGLIFLLLLAAGSSWAEAPDKRWYFGAGLSYLSTTDYIRSNAAIVYTEQFGDDGLPFTADPNELTVCAENFGNFYPAQDPFCDPRPDYLLDRKGVVEDNYKLDVTAGLQMTERLAIQLEGGYFQGEVGPIDVFQTETYPVKNRQGIPTSLVTDERSNPVRAGDMSEIYVSLSGIVRFWNAKAFRPYIGAGIGLIKTNFEVNEDGREEFTSLINSSRVRGWANEFGTDLTDPEFNMTIQREDGEIPFTLPLRMKVDDATEWHLTSGLEYFFNDRFSLVFDARWVFVDQRVELDLGGEDQLDIVYWPAQLYRPDGSLEIYFGGPAAPNPVCGPDPSAIFKYGCFGQNKNSRVNPEGLRADPMDSNKSLPGVKCPDFGDFNRDGKLDVCYVSSLRSLEGNPVSGFWVVQGGSIDLDAFTVAISLRLHL